MAEFIYNQEKILLTQAVKNHNIDEIKQIADRLAKKISTEQIGSLLFEVIETLPPDDAAWAYTNLLPEEAWEEMQQNALVSFYEILLEKGFESGRDFSVTPDGVKLSLEANEALLRDIPLEYRKMYNDLLQIGAIAIETESPILLLESRLGVPFVNNILELIAQRFPTLSDGEAATYLFNIFQGVQARTDIPMLDLIIGKFRDNMRFNNIFEVMEAGDFQANNDWMIDLILAAGGKAELITDPEKPEQQILSPQSQEILDKVYLELYKMNNIN